MFAKRWLLLLGLVLCAQSALAGRLVELSVLDRAEHRRLPVHWQAGSAYVAGQPGHEYHLVLRNRTGARVLAIVSVDGVNVVSGRSAHPSQSGYVIAPHGQLVIKGWRKSLAQTAAFYFTDLADSYAARTGRPDNVGVIGVAVYREKHAPPVPIAREAFPGAAGDAGAGKRAAPAESAPAPGRPSNELRRDEAEAASRLGTGHGRRETSHARYVRFERATPDPAEVVQLRYDSRANLVARGVIRDPGVCAWPCPQPFPGFVPDPGEPISYFSP